MKYSLKSGISLIAVLMFMLAATTASIVVFRMLTSENVASGARLKMSESEAAANSGLDAVQAWLENKASEVGVLVSDYLNVGGQPNPLYIDNTLLGSVGGNRNQNYKVYLIGADVSSNVYKLKFASVGTARDGSQNTQIGIFGVGGLYRLSIPYNSSVAPFNEAFFGKAGKLTDGTEFNSAIFNGDVSGNMPKITENFVATGNATFQGGTSATCGKDNSGDLYIVGQLKPNGNLKVCGNAYVGSLICDSGADCIFEKNLYVKNSITIGKNFTVKGNLTIENGDFNYSADFTSTIEGDLVFKSSTGKIVRGGNSGITVKGTTWIPSGNISNDSRVNLSGVAGRPVYIDKAGTCPPATLNNVKSTGGWQCSLPTPLEDYVDLASDLYNEIGWRLEDGGGTVEDPIKIMDVEEWIKKAMDMPAKCGANSITGLQANYSVRLGSSGTTFINEINTCYAKLNETDLFNGYFPLLVDNDQDKDLSGATLNGNYFFIFLGSGSFTFPKTGTNPKTTGDAYLMAYFLDNKHSVTYKGQTVNGTNNTQGMLKFPSNKPNIFIFSERNLGEINGAQFNGSVFMANGTTASTFQGAVKIEFNEDLYNSLVAAGILDFTKAGEKLAGETNGGGTTNNKYDYRHTALTQRLKVALESRYVSVETLQNLNDNNNLKPAVLVMPRILYLPKDVSLGSTNHEFDSYFSVLYLNGLKDNLNRNTIGWRAARGATSCKSLGDNSQLPIPLTEGDYQCTFITPAPAYADTFFVRISGELGFAKVGFNGSGATISDDTEENSGGLKCATVNLKYEAGTEEQLCTPVSIRTSNLPSGWSIQKEDGNVGGSGSGTNWGGISMSSADSYYFTVCSESTVSTGSVVFEIGDFGGCGAGQNTEFTVTRIGSIKADIKRERDPALNSRPDCDGYSLAGPSQGSLSWGAFQINSTASCKTTETKYEYSCSATNEYDVSLQLASGFTMSPECEFINAPPSLQISSTKETAETIYADIKRKEFSLSIVNPNNLTVTLSADVCLNLEQDCSSGGNKLPPVSCSGNCTVTMYAGVTYDVGISGQTLVAVDANLAKSGFSGNGKSGTLAIANPGTAGTRILTLSTLNNPSISCAVKSGAEIIVGQSLLSNEAVELKLMEISASVENNQDRCLNPEATYKVFGNGVNQSFTSWSPAIGNGYKVVAEISCDAGNTVDGKVTSVEEKECTGSFSVVEETTPTITCTWGNGAADYYIGAKPSVNVTVTKGNTTTCGSPSVTASNFSNFTPGWTVTGTSPNYTISATSALTTSETNRSVTVKTTCTGGSKDGDYSESCVGKNVEEKLPDPSCDYEPSWCGDIAHEDVITGSSANGNFNSSPKRCVYIKGMTSGQLNIGNTTTVLINGESSAGAHYNNSNVNARTKADGGYYIYIPANTYVDIQGAATGSPDQCVMEPKLTCTWAPGTTTRFVSASDAIQTGGDVPVPAVKCDGVTVNSGITYRSAAGGATYGTTPWSGAVGPGTYQAWAYVASGCGTSAKEASCGGTLTVKRVPSMSNCAGTTGENVTLPTKPTQPTITLNDPSNVCSNDGSTAPNASWTNVNWTVSKNLTDVSNANWGNIFNEAGSYNTYRVKGKCGDYPTDLTYECSGSATVSGSGGGGGCDYDPSWCNGWPWEIVRTGTLTVQEASTCVFVTNITSFTYQSGTSKVNGVPLTANISGGNIPAAITPADGGYYIMTGSNTIQADRWNVTYGSPNKDCSSGINAKRICKANCSNYGESSIVLNHDTEYTVCLFGTSNNALRVNNPANTAACDFYVDGVMVGNNTYTGTNILNSAMNMGQCKKIKFNNCVGGNTGTKTLYTP